MRMLIGFIQETDKRERITSFKEKETRDMLPPANWEDAILVLQVTK